MSAKSRKPSRPESPDDLFGAIPATPSFDAFPRDLIAQLTAGEAKASEKPTPAKARDPQEAEPPAEMEPAVEEARPDRVPDSSDESVCVGSVPDLSTESNTRIRQAEPPRGADARPRQPKPTPDFAGRPVESDTPPPPSGPAMGLSDSADRPAAPLRRTKPALVLDTPGPSETYRNKLLPRPAHHTKNQRQLLAYLAANGNHITTYTLIAEETGIPVGTIRDVLRKFEQAGLIRKSKHVQGGLQGLRLTLTEAFSAQSAHPARASNTPVPPSVSTVAGPSLKERYISNPSINASGGAPGRSLLSPEAEEARLRLLALTDEDLAFYYPNVARTGFGREQLGQVLAHLAKQGKSPERLFTALEHADFEFAQGAPTDKDGQKVANPCGYLFNSLARTGYYRRPAGYVSAEEQAGLDAEAEALAVKGIQERAGRAEFEAWLSGLSPRDLEQALAGCKGPREQWLRHYYETQARRKG